MRHEKDPTLHSASFDVIKLWRWLFKKDTWRNWMEHSRRYARALHKPRKDDNV